jgi:hypothetical protein
MSMDQVGNGNTLQERLVTLEMAFSPQGVLGRIAAAGLSEPYTLSRQEAADVILPPRQSGGFYQPRFVLIENTPPVLKDAAEANSDEVLNLANQVGMTKTGEQVQADIAKIDPEKADFVVEGGANRTSVVRRSLAVQAMRGVYGKDIEDNMLYQFGSGRAIPQVKNDKPNPEYEIAKEIAGDHISENELTEFDLNKASALQDGYEVFFDGNTGLEGDDIPYIERLVLMSKAGSPTLVLLQPVVNTNGFKDGITALQAFLADSGDSLNGTQLVVATNGQYRPKDEFQATQWARENGIEWGAAPVLLGDEPGYTVNHNGRDIVTANRQPMAYVNEMVILQRLANQRT